jgi:hypothetical protein
VLLDDHQAWFLAEEDLIAGGLFDAAAAEVVHNGQQGRRSTPGLVGHAAELGDAGRLPFLGRLWCDGLVHEHDQETAADGEADAFGLSRASKGGQAVKIEEEGIGEQVLELSDAALQVVNLVAELLELSLGVVAVEGVQDGLGVAVESLSGQSELVGALGDLAVGPVENGVGVGDTEFGG